MGISKSINGNLTNEVGCMAGEHEPRGEVRSTYQKEDVAEPARERAVISNPPAGGPL
jgi:hypothetical protein